MKSRSLTWCAAASAVCLAASLLSGCHPTANLRKPATGAMPATFTPDMRDTMTIVESDSASIAALKWWEIFRDPVLLDLIERAVSRNRTLLAAAEHVEEVREIYGIAKSNYYPRIGFDVHWDQETKWRHGKDDGPNGSYTPDPQYHIKPNISWEFNLWGKLNWEKKQAKNDFIATVEDERAMRMSIISQVAEAYFSLIALDNEYEIVKTTMETRGESMEKARLRYESGLTSEIVYQQARTDFLEASALVPEIERQRKLLRDAIAVLTGVYPTELLPEPTLEFADALPPTLPTGIPSQLLKQRPDLRAAEARVRAASAAVGVAYTDRFPSFVVGLTGGFWNSRLTDIFKSPYFNPMVGVKGDIFDFGRKQKNYRASIARYNQATYAYEQAVLSAFAEVRDAVISYDSYHKAVNTTRELSASAEDYCRIATMQYRAGTLSFLDVLDARRRLLSSRINMCKALRNEYIAFINLYKALGGGWETPADVNANVANNVLQQGMPEAPESIEHYTLKSVKANESASEGSTPSDAL